MILPAIPTYDNPPRDGSNSDRDPFSQVLLDIWIACPAHCLSPIRAVTRHCPLSLAGQ